MAQKIRQDKSKKHLLYSIFNPKGKEKGLTKEEAQKLPRNFVNFFRFYFDNFNTMFALNIFAFLGNFPILFGLYALTGNLNVNSTAPASSLFAPLYGAITAGGPNPASAALFGVHGAQAAISLPTTATKVFFLLTLLAVFTFGPVNTAIAYIMRNIVKGESVSFFGDIRYSIRKNLKQALILGVLDLLFTAVILYDLFFFFVGSTGSLTGFLFGVMIAVAVIYVMMHYYMYIMLVTFDLSVWKIIKNSFIFAILGIKRNIVAVLCTVAVYLMDYYFLILFLPIGVILPALVLVGMTTFMGIYAAYPKVKEIMIDPYYVSDSVGAARRDEEPEEGDGNGEEPVFSDRG